MAAGEIRVGNSILPNLTIAAASSADDDAPQDDDVLIFQDNEMDKMDANLSSNLTMTSCFNNDQRVIRPSLTTNNHRTDNMSSLLSKMSTSENFVVMEDFEQVADLNRLEEPSILAIEDVLRWGIKYNQTAFALKKLRPEAMFMVGVNELSTELILGYLRGLEPTEIEWIDDNSCNLVWNSADDCIRALLKISKEQENLRVVPELAEKSITPEDFLKDEQELKDKKAMPPPSVLKIPSKEPKNRDYNNVLRDCIIPLYANGKKYDLEVRLAVASDKKMRGSQHKSRYYQRNGNPNYKNMTGLISGTMRNRLDSQRMEEDKKHFGITPILPQQNGITSRLGRKAPQYDDMDDLMGGDDEHGLMNTRASDLNDVISNDAPPLPPVKIEDKGPDDQEGFGTMVADREQKVSQHKSHVSNLSQVFGKKTGVHSRLGHKEEPTGLVISVNNMNNDSSSSSDSSSSESSNSSGDMTYEIDVRKTKKSKSSKSKRDKKSSRSRNYEKDEEEEDKYSSRKSKTKKESSSRKRESEKEKKSRDYDREERKYSEDKYLEDKKYREARSREDDRRADRYRDERSREDRSDRHREHRDPRDDRHRDDRVRDDRVRDDRVRDDRVRDDRVRDERVRDERVSDRHHQDRHRDPRDDRNREDRHREDRHQDSRDDRHRDERYQTSSRRDRSRSPVRSSRRDTEKASSGWDNKDYREYNKNRTYTREEEKREKSASPKRKHRGATPPSSSSSSNDSSSSDSDSSSSSSNDSDSSSSSSDDDESMTVTMTVPSVSKSPSRAY